MVFDDEFQHSVPENSCFFQGHKGQFFTKNGISFRVTKNNYDDEELEKINIIRYKRTLLRSLRSKLGERDSDGGLIPIPKDEEIVIKYVKLVNSSKDDGICGFHQIYPKTAMCTESNCNQYFDLREGKRCGHSNESRWDQINFVAFCDSCGRVIPLQYASNLGYDCNKCGAEKSLTRLSWNKKDDLSTYKVSCKNCHRLTSLFFHDCNHLDRVNNVQLSSKEKDHFRGVPARAGSVIHPVVLTIPDVLDFQEGTSLTDRKSASDAFYHFFPELEESIFDAPEFKDALLKDMEFWQKKSVEFLAQGKSISQEALKIGKDHSKFKRFLRILLKLAKDMESEDHEKTKEDYGISNLEKAMKEVPVKTNLDEEWEGIFLVGQDDSDSESTQPNSEKDMKNYGNVHSYIIRSKPSSLPNEQYNHWLGNKSLKMVRHVAGLNMIQSILGVIEGSTRNKVPLFNVILSGSKNQQKPTIFVRTFVTEGIVFQLDYVKILNWFEANEELISPGESLSWDKTRNPETEYQNIIRDNLLYRNTAYTLLHTYSHMLIQQSNIHTGLDTQSLSEKIYPNVAAIFLYSTNNINIGGLESTFDSDLINWFEKMYELASDCPQDPSCMIDEDGACNACSYVPEFVCQNFNQNLDRSTLVGNSTRFSRGFFNDNKPSS
jgi:hypothetical protein